jgi:small-conductance mechanosensitive channel
MPASAEKIAANQRNAQKSTGPRTAAGKQIAALNAQRHGLSSKTLYVPPARQAEFEAMKACYWAEVQPIGMIQQELFNQLLHAAWNLEIVRELIARAFEANGTAALDRLHRYLGQHERAFHRALRTLRTLQTDRAIKQIPEHQHLENLPDTVAPAPVIHQINATAKRTQTSVQFMDPLAPRPASEPPISEPASRCQ